MSSSPFKNKEQFIFNSSLMHLSSLSSNRADRWIKVELISVFSHSFANWNFAGGQIKSLLAGKQVLKQACIKLGGWAGLRPPYFLPLGVCFIHKCWLAAGPTRALPKFPCGGRDPAVIYIRKSSGSGKERPLRLNRGQNRSTGSVPPWNLSILEIYTNHLGLLSEYK